MTAADRFPAAYPVELPFGGHPQQAGPHGQAPLHSVP